MNSSSGARQVRAVENDVRIRAAALELLSTGGWEALTQSAVASGAGLSRTAVANRFENTSGLAIAVWEWAAEPVLTSALTALLPDLTSTEEFRAALDELTVPNDALRAAAELLVSAQYDAALSAEVSRTLGSQVLQWCGDERVDVVIRARRAFALSLGLGALFGSWLPFAPDVNWSEMVSKLFVAFAADVAPIEAPEMVPYNMSFRSGLAPDDAALQSLLVATLEEVAVRGFDGASVKAIARASGYTEGLIFSRYKTKAELFLDAANRQQALALQRGYEFQLQMLEQYGHAVLASVMLQEAQLPIRQTERRVTFELVRLSWHHQAFMDVLLANLARSSEGLPDEAQAWFAVPANKYYSVVIQLGAGELAHLYSDAWKLPYDVVTVPLETQ